MKRNALAVLFAGIWITLSEFLRNELLFKSYWTDHYESLGLEFETLLVNGFWWFVWSLLLSLFIYRLLTRFSFVETVILSWVAAFVMMWITAYNLQVLPLGLLTFAVPLSILEVLVGAIIIKKSP